MSTAFPMGKATRRHEQAIDVVIPRGYGRDMPKRCLEELAAQTVEHRTIVVDNGPQTRHPNWPRQVS